MRTCFVDVTRNTRVVVTGLSGLHKKVSVRSRFLTSVRNNLICVIFVCITICFSETQVLLCKIYEHCFVITDFMHRRIWLIIVCISVRIFLVPIAKLSC